MENILKIGDKILYRPSFGWGTPVEVVVKGLEITDYPREKYGETVKAVDIATVKANRVLMTLDNGHWAYGEQFDRKVN